MRATALFLLILAGPAAAQVVTPPPCDLRSDCIGPMPVRFARIERTSSDARVTLNGNTLRYEITETFTNRGTVVGEAEYLLPLPRGAAFEDLALEINGELVSGETMASERARGIYEEIVRRSRDPALVEWMGHGLLRARIFPIAPGESKHVVVRFRAVAQREGHALRIEYLAGGRAAGSAAVFAPPTLELLIPRGDTYGTPFSPTHQIEIGTPSAQNEALMREVRVRGDASHLTLLVPVRESSRAAVTALPYAPPGEDGFAMITLSPPVTHTARAARDLTFVIDVSGSMSGAKIDQARAAGRTLLGTLSPGDRFRMISFSTDVDEFRNGWTVVTNDDIRAAQRWLDDLRATGSTNIAGALERALELAPARDHLGLVLFLTDGAATVGERDPARLAATAGRLRGAQRVFTFGVGADVQADMLERIALEGRGTAQFVQPNEDVEHAVSVVAQRLTAPVATNVRLRADGVSLRQVQPDAPQDVFAGQDLTLFVRYHGAGATTLTFEGETPNGPVTWTERVTLPERSHDNAFVAKLWAVQRIGWLSAERHRAGANNELDNELRELGTRYGIPTELSSYLVVEQGVMGGTTVRPDAFQSARAAAEQRASKSLADMAPATPALRQTGHAAAPQIRQLGDRTFMERDGRWTDTRYRDGVRQVSVKPFSAAYFALIARIPELAPLFALGENVTTTGHNVVLILDAQGAEQLSAGDLALVVRDW